MKRKFKGDLETRIFLIQMKENANKMIVCNLHRILQFLLINVFCRANSLMIIKTETLHSKIMRHYI